MTRKEPLLGKLYCTALTIALLLCFFGIAGAVIFVTWTRPGSATANQSATTDNNGVARFSTSGGRGTYTLTVNNIAKTGYTFDPAKGVLSKSISK